MNLPLANLNSKTIQIKLTEQKGREALIPPAYDLIRNLMTVLLRGGLGIWTRWKLSEAFVRCFDSRNWQRTQCVILEWRRRSVGRPYKTIIKIMHSNLLHSSRGRCHHLIIIFILIWDATFRRGTMLIRELKKIRRRHIVARCKEWMTLKYVLYRNVRVCSRVLFYDYFLRDLWLRFTKMWLTTFKIEIIWLKYYMKCIFDRYFNIVFINVGIEMKIVTINLKDCKNMVAFKILGFIFISNG